MSDSEFVQQLNEYGPDSALYRGSVPVPTLDESQDYCRRLATSHYENFSIASRLLPKRFRQPFYNIYAYCRWSDDLGDEVGDPAESLRLLDWWALELRRCFDGRRRHPVFVALQETIHAFDLSIRPFADLLVAFRRDQRISRYETMGQLIDYCRYSASPVGRIILQLADSLNDQTRSLSDDVCTGLQLVNFWQDVARDWDAGRLYIPRDVMRRFGYDEPRIQNCREMKNADNDFRSMLADLVDDARRRLRAGEELARLVPRWLRLDILLFMRGGLAVADAIDRQNYDVWIARPKLSKMAKLWLVLRSLPDMV